MTVEAIHPGGSNDTHSTNKWGDCPPKSLDNYGGSVGEGGSRDVHIESQNLWATLSVEVLMF